MASIQILRSNSLKQSESTSEYSRYETCVRLTGLSDSTQMTLQCHSGRKWREPSGVPQPPPTAPNSPRPPPKRRRRAKTPSTSLARCRNPNTAVPITRPTKTSCPPSRSGMRGLVGRAINRSTRPWGRGYRVGEEACWVAGVERLGVGSKVMSVRLWKVRREMMMLPTVPCLRGGLRVVSANRV